MECYLAIQDYDKSLWYFCGCPVPGNIWWSQDKKQAARLENRAEAETTKFAISFIYGNIQHQKEIEDLISIVELE